ncbi:hypothetical protein ACVIRM_000185 [Rhizobium laguerreae]
MKAMALTRHLPIGVTREIWIERRERIRFRGAPFRAAIPLNRLSERTRIYLWRDWMRLSNSSNELITWRFFSSRSTASPSDKFFSVLAALAFWFMSPTAFPSLIAATANSPCAMCVASSSCLPPASFVELWKFRLACRRSPSAASKSGINISSAMPSLHRRLRASARVGIRFLNRQSSTDANSLSDIMNGTRFSRASDIGPPLLPAQVMLDIIGPKCKQ